MRDHPRMGMTLRFEIFPADLDAAVDFYARVLGFQVTKDQRGDPEAYVALRRGGVRVGAARRAVPGTPSVGARPSAPNSCSRSTTWPQNATGSWRPGGHWRRTFDAVRGA